MVTLPPEFIATKYPGYFWNVNTNRLYSLKVSGELRPLKHIKPNRWNNMWRYSPTGGYRVSVKGRNRYLYDDYLNNLQPSDCEIPVNENNS